MSLFPAGARYDDNYRLLLGILVEKLGGSVTITHADVNSMALSRKSLYIEASSHDDAVTLEVVPSGS